MGEQIPVGDGARVDEHTDGSLHEVAADVAYQRLAIVNVVYLGAAGAGAPWVLVDAGVAGSGAFIRRAVARRFGDGARPQAIVLTHGHFDHVGVLRDLAEEWQVPIYAHPLELPYLTGQASYPPPDPGVGGGLMAASARLYPRGPVVVTEWLHALPEDGTVPHLPGWSWLHTPGHTPGHVSLWRAADRTLVAGDAFVATDQESAYSVATQRPELHGPPMYYTQDWTAARDSVRRLAALEPELVVTGHGRALQGAEMRTALHALARDFDAVALPESGRYVEAPARPGGEREAYPEP